MICPSNLNLGKLLILSDCPKSRHQVCPIMDSEKKVYDTTVNQSPDPSTDQERDVALHTAPLAEVPKGRWDRTWPVIACGAGLFSDGYLNGVIGSVSTMLELIYGDEYSKSSARSAIPSIAFAGTVVGHLFFGILSDHWSRRNSLLISTISMVPAPNVF